MSVSALRIREVNQQQPSGAGDYVLYWMISARRTTWNHALDRALEWCRDLGKPLVILEGLRSNYPWASDRLHQFVIDGMIDNAAAIEARAPQGVLYYPYLEPAPGAASGLVEALAQRASVVVTDDYPCFFLPRMVAAAAGRVPVRLEAIDSNGLLPMRATNHVFVRALDFRRFLQRHLHPHLESESFPHADPLRRLSLPALPSLPAEFVDRWPRADLPSFARGKGGVSRLPIDHSVPATSMPGGQHAARKALALFLGQKLDRYALERNRLENSAASGLSPYLHFGHLGTHQIVHALLEREEWSLDKVSRRVTGKGTGWWGLSPSAEAFLDELITWRELGFNFCSHRDDYDRYDSLPTWARDSLSQGADDPREHLYSLQEFEQAATHDELWNAAQRQLVREGRIHNYLRMLWGKKVLEWTSSPQEALAILIELNNKYALDGRDPNSYSGIFWVFGRYDRPWAPHRPIFGTVRWMSSENTARKMNVKPYLREYGPQAPLFAG